jgi:hypothetical protein
MNEATINVIHNTHNFTYFLYLLSAKITVEIFLNSQYEVFHCPDNYKSLHSLMFRAKDCKLQKQVIVFYIPYHVRRRA